MLSSSTTEHFDVIIIGAGISGIDAAYHIKKECPHKSFTIFEGRSNIGGTWDLFRYPGIRSDSDMYTFSYSFKPWNHSESISDANLILNYLKETVAENDLEKHIRFNHMMEQASWSSEKQEWTITGKKTDEDKTVQVTCNFLLICTGYYNYKEGYTPDYKGLERYQGEFVHPQKWTSDIVHKDKKIVVIGSGATAVTLVPALAETAKHVTMLQRSPSYVMSRPLEDVFAKFAHRLLPDKAAHFLARWKNILLSMYLYSISRRRPAAVKKYIMDQIKKIMGTDYDVDTHFNPDYKPWDQRLCIVPDNDLFLSIKEGKSSVVTDHIDTFTEKGLLLKSGKELEADMIVSATGLKLQMAGGMKFFVDGQFMEPGKMVSYKGIMLKDMPNMAAIVGYTNASWTLKADLTCIYICRLLNHMDAQQKKVCTPIFKDDNMEMEPILDFSSSYVTRALDRLPKQGSKLPWKLHQNYIKDMIILKYQKIDDGYLKFE